MSIEHKIPLEHLRQAAAAGGVAPNSPRWNAIARDENNLRFQRRVMNNGHINPPYDYFRQAQAENLVNAH